MTNWDSGMEYEMFKDSEPSCERCGATGVELSCGDEWGMKYCCADCASRLAWEEEQQEESET